MEENFSDLSQIAIIFPHFEETEYPLLYSSALQAYVCGEKSKIVLRTSKKNP